MNYRQYSDHVKLCQYLGKEPEGEFKGFYDFFTGLWGDMVIDVFYDYDTHVVILYKGVDFYMGMDTKTDYLVLSYDKVWSPFLSLGIDETIETILFIQKMFVEHLNIPRESHNLRVSYTDKKMMEVLGKKIIQFEQ
jgi:hypothetical protein